MKFTIEAECGDKTCASEPGKFCVFFGTKSFGQKGYCHFYGRNLFDEGGWIQRCQECLKEHPAPGEDSPSLKWANGSKEWRVGGRLHRENGPAVEHPDGAEEWWINGKLHREDGPALKWAGGSEEWFLDGVKYPSEEAFKEALKDLKKTQES